MQISLVTEFDVLESLARDLPEGAVVERPARLVSNPEMLRFDWLIAGKLVVEALTVVTLEELARHLWRALDPKSKRKIVVQTPFKVIEIQSATAPTEDQVRQVLETVTRL